MKLHSIALLAALLAAAALAPGSEAVSSPNNRRMLTFGLGLHHHRAWWAGWLQHPKVRRGDWPDDCAALVLPVVLLLFHDATGSHAPLCCCHQAVKETEATCKGCMKDGNCADTCKVSEAVQGWRCFTHTCALQVPCR